MGPRSDHGPWWWSVVHHCNPSPNQAQKIDQASTHIHSSDHSLWSVSVDQDSFTQPLT
ncbi:hypothetical protein MTR67_026060 [Solanum verrucosum]|uniref:Uncharacterized protein n=1 Tax=Solanum verrucosum TaxID=315347 RepID=A0AAF0R1L1_SOLVR|nr:hypothetical protein MTR67_026060 [Solanum verrucosum]